MPRISAYLPVKSAVVLYAAEKPATWDDMSDEEKLEYFKANAQTTGTTKVSKECADDASVTVDDLAEI